LDKGITMKNAVDICDAYYGDENEVSKCFQSMRKPVMIEDYTILGEE